MICGKNKKETGKQGLHERNDPREPRRYRPNSSRQPTTNLWRDGRPCTRVWSDPKIAAFLLPSTLRLSARALVELLGDSRCRRPPLPP